jgi:hypothetical protein
LAARQARLWEHHIAPLIRLVDRLGLGIAEERTEPPRRATTVVVLYVDPDLLLGRHHSRTPRVPRQGVIQQDPSGDRLPARRPRRRAMACAQNPRTYYGAWYRCIAARHGPQWANVAIQHSILTPFRHMGTTAPSYVDPAADYLTRIAPRPRQQASRASEFQRNETPLVTSQFASVVRFGVRFMELSYAGKRVRSATATVGACTSPAAYSRSGDHCGGLDSGSGRTRSPRGLCLGSRSGVH